VGLIPPASPLQLLFVGLPPAALPAEMAVWQCLSPAGAKLSQLAQCGEIVAWEMLAVITSRWTGDYRELPGSQLASFDPHLVQQCIRLSIIAITAGYEATNGRVSLMAMPHISPGPWS
jgi:hypothetical protein